MAMMQFWTWLYCFTLHIGLSYAETQSNKYATSTITSIITATVTYLPSELPTVTDTSTTYWLERCRQDQTTTAIIMLTTTKTSTATEFYGPTVTVYEAPVTVTVYETVSSQPNEESDTSSPTPPDTATAMTMSSDSSRDLRILRWYLHFWYGKWEHRDYTSIPFENALAEAKQQLDALPHPTDQQQYIVPKAQLQDLSATLQALKHEVDAIVIQRYFDAPQIEIHRLLVNLIEYLSQYHSTDEPCTNSNELQLWHQSTPLQRAIIAAFIYMYHFAITILQILQLRPKDPQTGTPSFWLLSRKLQVWLIILSLTYAMIILSSYLWEGVKPNIWIIWIAQLIAILPRIEVDVFKAKMQKDAEEQREKFEAGGGGGELEVEKALLEEDDDIVVVEKEDALPLSSRSDIGEEPKKSQ